MNQSLRVPPYTAFNVCNFSERPIAKGGPAHTPPGFRAAPRAVFVVTAIRRQSLPPSRLRRCALCLPPGDRRKAPSPPRDAWRPWGRTEPARAGSARPAPHHSGRTWRIRRGLLRQVVQMRAALDAGGSLPGRHEGRFSRIHGYGRPALPWSSTPRLKRGRRRAGEGRVAASRWGLALPVSGGVPLESSCGDAELAMPPFGVGSAQGVLVWL